MKLTNICTNIYTFFQNPLRDVQKLICFDIETTGLSRKYSHLYLIGAVISADESGRNWEVRQWFAEKPSEEKELLIKFSEFLSDHPGTLVHFNGSTFDIPYLAEKYRQYQLENPFAGFHTEIDLYKEARKLAPLLSLPSYKQKSLEEFLGIFRKDPYHGGELIAFYQEYLQSASPEIQDMLLLHNYEDITALPHLLSLLYYQYAMEGRWSGVSVSLQPAQTSGTEAGLLQLRGTLQNPVPKELHIRSEQAELLLQDQLLILRLPVVHAEMKHYFADFRSYFYLPLEDYAIHKSIGIYVDAKHRQNAKAATCYQKATSDFIFIQSRFGEKLRIGNRELPLYFNAYKGDLCALAVSDLEHAVRGFRTEEEYAQLLRLFRF